MKSLLAMVLIGVSGVVFAQEHSDTSITRGHLVYGKFCAKCHGQDGNGQGKDAWKYSPPPTNFKIALAPRGYMEKIVKMGGKALGRSDDMPDWGTDLNDQQIQEVVDFLMSVRAK